MNGDFAVDEKDQRNLQKPGGNPAARSFTQYRIVSRSSELDVGPSSGSKFSAIDFFRMLESVVRMNASGVSAQILAQLNTVGATEARWRARDVVANWPGSF
jgi:hypothetical protein